MEVGVLYLVVLSVIVAVGVFFPWFRLGSVVAKFKIGMDIWVVSEKELI